MLCTASSPPTVQIGQWFSTRRAGGEPVLRLCPFFPFLSCYSVLSTLSCPSIVRHFYPCLSCDLSLSCLVFIRPFYFSLCLLLSCSFYPLPVRSLCPIGNVLFLDAGLYPFFMYSHYVLVLSSSILSFTVFTYLCPLMSCLFLCCLVCLCQLLFTYPVLLSSPLLI